MEATGFEHSSETRIYGVKIYQEERGVYSFSVRHSGPFRLDDYKEIELEVTSAKLVRRKERPIIVTLEKGP